MLSRYLDVFKRIKYFILLQVFISTATALNLTVVALYLIELLGSVSWGGFAQASMIFGALMVTALTTQTSLIWGSVWSLRLSLLLATLGALICFLSAGFLESWIVFPGLFLLGSGTVSSLVSRFIAAERAGSQENSSLAVVIILLGSAVGAFLGPNIYGFLSKISNQPLVDSFQISFMLFAISLILLTGCSVENKKEEKGEYGNKRFGQCEEFRWGAYISALILGSLSHALMVALMGLAPVHTNHLLGAEATGWIMSSHLLGMYAFGPFISKILESVGEKKTVCLVILTFLISTFCLMWGNQSFFFFLLGLTGIGIGWSGAMITSSARVINIDKREERIRVQGRLDFSLNLAGGLSSLIAGFWVATFGYYALTVLVLVILLGVILLFLATFCWRSFHAKTG